MASTVFAAPRSINVYVDDFRQGNLNIRWDSVVGEAVKYIPLPVSSDLTKTMILNQTTNRTVIPNLLNDIVYDFDIIVYNGLDATGAEIARGFCIFPE